MRSILLACSSLTLAIGMATATASGQGAITHRNARFEFNESSTPGSVNFLPDGSEGLDHLFQYWWWYRTGDDQYERAFAYPAPIESYDRNVAEMEWSRPGFRARLTLILLDEGRGRATVRSAMTITNTTQQNLQFDLFSYADFDVGAYAHDDQAALLEPGRMLIFDDLERCQYLGHEATRFEVTPYRDLRDRLNDQLPTELQNTGLPFGPDDFTGGYQWTFTIPRGEAKTVLLGLASNMPAVAGPVLRNYGACPGPVSIEVHGATPGGVVALLYGKHPGPFRVPAGPCAGVTLDLSPPFYPGSPHEFVADASGFVRATGQLRSFHCGSVIVQAVDKESCRVTNSGRY